MRTLATAIAFFTLLHLPSAYFGESALDRAVEKKYGKLAVQKMKQLQYPGKLYPGISQDRNEESDEAAQKTLEMSMKGIDRERGKETQEIMKSAIDSHRNAISDWAGENADLKALEPLKSIKGRKTYNE